ncbi:receptor-like protein 19 [Corylus avellana]|uniref:receptor-like protein 19 n=1 Tax=Corylus avellana TaxID=13451 RepID=UPI001E234BC2|nr:receptor-like protein 19 [Corylus avellana]
MKFKESFTINQSASVDGSAYSKVSLWKPESGDCCKWCGVKCNKDTGHVISLDLSSCFLYGSINSSSSLFQLAHLQSLNLADNDFKSSRIPTGFRQLSRLTNLNLSYSVFSGQITSEILELSNLISLDLSRNSLKLQKPGLTSIARKLTNLKELHLSEVNISSTVPNILANLSSLTSLILAGCGLHGEFPTGIFHLPNLRSLDVRDNTNLNGRMPEFNRSRPLESLALSSTSFSGEIRHSIGKLKSLHYFDVEGCNFFGPMPSSLGNLTQLISLQLASNWLHGEFPIGIFHLPNLRSLDVSDNANLTGRMPEFNRSSPLESLALAGTSFSGEIPHSIGNLTQLISLHLEDNWFHGQFPIEIFHLPNLRSLLVSFNQNLTGSIPEFNRSSHLEILRLSGTNFSGELPESIGKLNSLYYFGARNCNLLGPMPSSLGNLTQLTFLQLGYNGLHGSIPQSISRLVNLEYLDISSNHLSGTVKFDLFLKLENLTHLSLSGNNISLLTKPSINATHPKFASLFLASCDLSEFPDFLKHQDNLLSLDLSHNKIHGQIPKWIWNLNKETLAELYLNSNSLTGFDQLPLFPTRTNLMILDLSSNKLRGSLPVPPPSIRWYSISNNTLTGEIPQSICNFSSILILDLSSNYLSGLLPQCLGNLSDSLTVLNLHDNNFHGTISEIFAKGNDLEMIDFSQNKLQGRLPRSLANCTNLEVLNLGNNQMNDAFPSWLGILPELRVLILRSNGIYGEMESSNSSFDFPNIRVIDLSHNNITGELPSQYFQNWKSMQSIGVHGLMYMQSNFYSTYIYSMTLINKGTKIVYERILVFFMAIDLSSNKFKGEIPEVVGHLKELKLLNLSNNFLTGPIPSCLGNLTELESLDFSQNKLDGVIPFQLTQLTFLESFNVSHNLLTGLIPQGNQFGTFPNSSFGNNPKLCGSPLANKCGNSKDAPPPPLTFEGNHSSDFIFEFSWKVVAMGYGCGFMLGLVLWQIMIRKKHDWVMKTLAIGQPKPRRVNWRMGQRN